MKINFDENRTSSATSLSGAGRCVFAALGTLGRLPGVVSDSVDDLEPLAPNL